MTLQDPVHKPDRPKTVTLKTVAELAGVSMKTVSRVVNREPNVSARTLEKVENAIAKLEFKPNMAARQLRGQRSYSLAVIYEPPSSEFLTGILEGILPVCRENSYKLLLEPLAATETRLHVNKMIERRVVDGFILLPPLSEDLELIQSILSAGLKTVLVESVLDISALNLSVSKVGIDDFAAGLEMGRHLIGMGHKRIGYVSLREQHSMANKRGEGLKSAMDEAGLPEDNFLYTRGESSFESGYAAGQILLERDDPPTAIFAGNDYMAAGVMSCARHLNFNVPQDLSVAGFDGADLSKMFVPPFTTIKQPLHTYGEWAAQNLLKSISDPKAVPVTKVMDHELFKRSSVASI